MIPQILTYSDAYEVLVDFARHSQSATDQSLRIAIQSAYRELVNSHDWNYLIRPGTVHLEGKQTTGTVVYDHTGGTYERQLTLTGATWPSNAVYWRIRFGTVTNTYAIATRKSDTVVTLDSQQNPGEDVASTTYTLFRSEYPLPNDFDTSSDMWGESTYRLGAKISPADWYGLEKNDTTTGEIEYHTIMGLHDTIGTMGLCVWPPPSEDQPVQFLYYRRPRALRHTGRDTNDKTGTVTVSENATALTGSGTTFTSTMVGSIIRFSSGSTVPTGMAGSNPYLEQRSIHAVTDTTHLTLDQGASNAHSGVAFCITDPVDLEQSLFEAFQACCRKILATQLMLKQDQAGPVYAAYRNALHAAKAAQHTSHAHRRMAPYLRLSDRTTIGSDVE